MTPPEPSAAELPALPEEIEAWIAAVQSDETAHAAMLSRRASARYARIATWQRSGAVALHDFVLGAVTSHVVEFGPCEFALDSSAPHDRCTWRSSIASQDEEIVLRVADPQALLTASWQLTFRAADMMLKAAATAPRLMSEVGNVYTSAMELHKESASAGEGTATAVVKAEAQDKKFERVIELLTMMKGDKGGKAAALPAADDESRTAAAARKLLGSIEGDDLGAVLSHPLGRTLATVSTWAQLQSTISGLWAAHSAGELKLSAASLEGARAVVRAFNQ